MKIIRIVFDILCITILCIIPKKIIEILKIDKSLQIMHKEMFNH